MNINNDFKSLTVVDKGNKKSRLTVDREANIRIKIGLDVPEDKKDMMIQILLEKAIQIIKSGDNTQTIRTSVGYREKSLNRLYERWRAKPNAEKYTVYL